MDLLTLAVAAAAFLVSGIFKGAVGIGQVTIAVALLGSVLSLRDAVPLLIVPALAANLWQVWRGGGHAALLQRFWVLNVAGCIGIWIGTAILYRVDPLILSAMLGIVVCLYAGASFAAPDLRLKPAREGIAAPLVGLASGILTGTTGSLHIAFAFYFQALGLDRDRFIQAVGLAFLIGSLIWAAALVGEGAFGPAEAVLSALALAPTFLGVFLGQWLRGRVSETAFRNAVLLFLVVLGLNLVRKGLL